MRDRGEPAVEIGNRLPAVEQHGRDSEPLQFQGTGLIATGTGHPPALVQQVPRQGGRAVAEAETEEMGRFGHGSYLPSRLAFSGRRHDLLRRQALLSGGDPAGKGGGFPWSSMRSILPILSLLLLTQALPALADQQQAGGDAAPAVASEAQQERKYQDCMSQAQSTPKQALKQAMAWEKDGGGDAARHCVAASYMGLKQYDDAAMELERIAETMPQVKAPIMAQLFGQAAQAWLQMGKPDRALADLNQGLKVAKNNVDLLVFRATIYGNEEKYFDALDDLNAAYDLTSDRGTILVMRATAYRKLQQPDLAKDNIDLALKADPNDPDALLEQGTQRAEAGDKDGARADWMKTIELAPDSPAADDARDGLAKLDVKAN
jgi:tetratricopeptide (TPR) repeat protein